MARNARKMKCSADDVFQVLANGWFYPIWVVGASRMRRVDDEWPEPGSRLHHSVGLWPMMLDDTTTCLLWEPPHRAVLRAKGWPFGEADVTITARNIRGGCVVQIHERETAGPASLIPSSFVDLLLRPRNRETLRRLAYLAEGQAALNQSAT